MNRLLLFIVLFSNAAFSQISNSFQEAYALNSFIPSGLLEAVSFSNTHMREITDQDANSCSGMPLPYGIMGLFANGAGYFIENGQIVANYSGISIANQKSAINLQILAYAKAINALMQVQTSIVREKNNPDKIRTVNVSNHLINDWTNIPFYPTAAKKKEMIQEYGQTKAEQIIEYSFTNSVDPTVAVVPPQMKQSPGKASLIQIQQYNQLMQQMNSKTRIIPPNINKFSPAYSRVIAAKPRATASANIRLGGVY